MKKLLILLLLICPLVAFGATQNLMVTCDAPTTRVDGTLLLQGEIRDYNFVLTKGSTVVSDVFVPTCDWDLPDIASGSYFIEVSVFDVLGLESDKASLSFNVNDRPNKAQNITITITIGLQR